MKDVRSQYITASNIRSIVKNNGPFPQVYPPTLLRNQYVTCSNDLPDELQVFLADNKQYNSIRAVSAVLTKPAPTNHYRTHPGRRRVTL